MPDPDINDIFNDAVTAGGVRPRWAGRESFRDISSNSSSNQNVRVRYRSGSFTDLHMHDDRLGTATHHSVRTGTVTTIAPAHMDADTASYVRARHGRP